MRNYGGFSNNHFELLFEELEGDRKKDSLSTELERNTRSLWRSVILQAVIDIVQDSKRTELTMAKIEARKWIFEDNKDFSTVCFWAGYNRNYIRRKVIEIIKRANHSKLVISYKDKKSGVIQWVRKAKKESFKKEEQVLQKERKNKERKKSMLGTEKNSKVIDGFNPQLYEKKSNPEIIFAFGRKIFTACNSFRN